MAQDSVDTMRNGMEDGADAAPVAPPCLLTEADVERIACAVVGKFVATTCASLAAAVRVWKDVGNSNGA